MRKTFTTEWSADGRYYRYVNTTRWLGVVISVETSEWFEPNRRFVRL